MKILDRSVTTNIGIFLNIGKIVFPFLEGIFQSELVRNLLKISKFYSVYEMKYQRSE